MDQQINIQDFTYELPQDRIAMFPLPSRDDSNLLVYNGSSIEHSQFKSLTGFLPKESFLFFNDTKVIPARVLFTKDTGAEIEVFLLNPIKPSTIMAEVMVAKNGCTWQCTIGNLKRWKENQLSIKL